MRTALNLSLFILLILGISISGFGKNSHPIFEDLTENPVGRLEFLNNEPSKPQRGIRYHIGGIKKGNKIVLPGVVNEGIDDYQNNLINHMTNLLNDENHKITQIHIRKSDFKGYFITCKPITPKYNCEDILYTYSKKKITKQIHLKGEKGSKATLKITTSKGTNYKQAYIKARFISIYDDYNEAMDIDKFASKKVQEIKQLFKDGIIDRKTLKQLISDYRRNGLESVTDINYKKTIILLDALEIPFGAADNHEKSLLKLLDNIVAERKLINGLQIGQVFSGDDLSIVVKDMMGINLDYIAADARNLGVTNMLTRFDEISSPESQIDNLDDIIKLSRKAIDNADKIMFDSMKFYVDFLEAELTKQLTPPKIKKLSAQQFQDKRLEILKKANQDYNQLASGNIKNMEEFKRAHPTLKITDDLDLMKMRAAITDPKDIKTIEEVRTLLNLTGEMHNFSKEQLEPSGKMEVITPKDLNNKPSNFPHTNYHLIIPECLKQQLNF